MLWIGSTIDERTILMVLDHVVSVAETYDIPLYEKVVSNVNEKKDGSVSP